jgi:phosphotransferase system HPr-like phosphotransfer protein
MEKFSSTITVSRGGDTRNGKEFYELMKLRNVKGEKTTFKAEGPDENETINSVIEFMDEHAELS